MMLWFAVPDQGSNTIKLASFQPFTKTVSDGLDITNNAIYTLEHNSGLFTGGQALELKVFPFKVTSNSYADQLSFVVSAFKTEYQGN